MTPLEVVATVMTAVAALGMVAARRRARRPPAPPTTALAPALAALGRVVGPAPRRSGHGLVRVTPGGRTGGGRTGGGRTGGAGTSAATAGLATVVALPRRGRLRHPCFGDATPDGRPGA